jgi:hypothetical protein
MDLLECISECSKVVKAGVDGESDLPFDEEIKSPAEELKGGFPGVLPISPMLYSNYLLHEKLLLVISR